MRTPGGAALAAAVIMVASCTPGPQGPGGFGAPARAPQLADVQLPQPVLTPDEAVPCTAEQVGVVLEGLDAATGNRWGTLRAVNRSDVPCTLHGSPGLMVEQDGRQLDLTIDHGPSEDLPEPSADVGPVRLERQQSATAAVFWRGYGTAADQTAGQTVRATLHDGTVLDVAMGTHAPGPVFDLVDGGRFAIDRWIAGGYGPPGYDDPVRAVETTTRCVSSDLVAGVRDVPGSSGTEDAEPVASLWVANVGLVPCRTGDLALVSGAGEVVLRDARGAVVLLPGSAAAGTVAMSDLDRARATHEPWHVRAGTVEVRVLSSA